MLPENTLNDVSQVPAVSSLLVTVRVQVQSGVHERLRNAARLSSLTSPPVEGFAARKFANVSSRVKPASAAWSTCTRPLPTSSMFHDVTPSSWKPSLLAVVCNADLTSGTVQSGCTARISAPAPAVCGEDIEVPLRNA